MNLIISFTSGIIFSVGLIISGMTNPKKVQGFLDIFGDWDASLIFVMVGAISVSSLSFLFVKNRKPLCSDTLHIPTRKDIDKKLIFGSALFGIGWALMGICPGPAFVNLVTGHSQVIIFVLSMLSGMFFYQKINKEN